MTCRRPSLACACASLAAIAVIALPAVPASAASPKVLLLTRNEEGNGPPAAQGEPAFVNNFVKWPAEQADCGGTDEGATVGKNPSGTVKVSGSDAPIGTYCFGEGAPEMPPGSITVKSVSLAKSGAVTLTGKLEVTADGCTYRATKLTGTQLFGEEEEFYDTLSGTAKLRPHSASTCAETTAVEDVASVANTADYNYTVELT